MDREKKKLMKVVIPLSLVFVIGSPLLMWLFDKVHSWKDVLLNAGSGLILAILWIACWLFGWIKPKKDE